MGGAERGAVRDNEGMTRVSSKRHRKALYHAERALSHLNEAAAILGAEWDDYDYDSLAAARAAIREWSGWERQDAQPRLVPSAES